MLHEEEQPSRKILLLDDEPAVLKLLTGYLRCPAVELIACQEIEAAECLLNHHSFDVLVSDLQVSDVGGIEGIRLLRHVTQNFPATKTIIFSGLVDDKARSLAAALGVDEVLEKPGDLMKLRRLVLPPGDGRHGEPTSSPSGRVFVVESVDDVLANGQIVSYVQPILDIQSGPPYVPLGVESLSRGPEGSMLRNPELLFGYAARKDRSYEADMLAARAAFGSVGGVFNGRAMLFLNVQPRSMSHPDFAASLSQVTREAGYAEQQVVLEITEQQTIVNSRAFSSTVETLRSHGFRIALDDYGEGFANLHLVHQLHPDFLKISGYFCQNIDKEASKKAIVGGTVDLAARLNMATVMEQVETKEELAEVRRLGVRYAQGYYFARPAPARDLARSEFFSVGR